VTAALALLVLAFLVFGVFLVVASSGAVVGAALDEEGLVQSERSQLWRCPETTACWVKRRTATMQEEEEEEEEEAAVGGRRREPPQERRTAFLCLLFFLPFAAHGQ